MKFLILLLISFSAMASYLPESKVGKSTDGLTIYSKKEKCEQVYSEPCISIRKTGNNSFHKIQPEAQMKQDVESCIDGSDCQAKLEIKVCSHPGGQAIKNLDLMEIYCTWTRKKQIVEDAALKAQYLFQENKNKQDKIDAKNAVKALKDEAVLTDAQRDQVLKYLLEKL